MDIFKKHAVLLFIVIISLIGGLLRFYNLSWGAPFFFHPDERNISSSVSQLNFPTNLNPHFFAYGSLPIYLTYFAITLAKLNFSVSFEQAILVSRFISFLLSTLLIPLMYLLGKKMGGKTTGILSALFTTTSVGFIQFAHFGTFETWLTFLVLLLFYFSLNLMEKINSKNIIALGIALGLLLSTKISSLVLLALPILSIVLSKSNKHIFSTILRILTIYSIAIVIFIATSPFAFFDFSSFLSSIKYESSVAFGTLSVFYTGEFFDTIPITFQFLRLYPFLINPILTILFIPSFFYLTFKGLKTKNLTYVILNTSYLILFLSQAFLFAKWTRYMVPTLPFMYLIVAISLERFIKKKALSIKYLVLSIIIASNVLFSLSYFITAQTKPDARISASLWAKERIPSSSKILSEVYDLGITPFNQYFPHITLFNFYDLDEIPVVKPLELKALLETNNYIVLPSQRIIKTRLIHKDKFPNGNYFYTDLLNGKLGYQKVYETPCDIFCKITYLGDPTFSLEQTVSVFDRPTVFIFKKL